MSAPTGSWYVMEEVSEKERQGLKELIDEDFGLLELATTAGRDVIKRKGA